MGKLILVIGPSGSGKSALLSHVRAMRPDIVFPVSCTTRSPRPGEVSGQSYYFVTPEEFAQRVEAGEFIEWATYGGNRYGTLNNEVIPSLTAGKTVLREVEVQGARLIRDIFPREQLGIIFIDAGSWEELKKRIVARAPISDEELTLRHKRYDDETSFEEEADIVVSNRDGELESAKEALLQAIATLESRE